MFVCSQISLAPCFDVDLWICQKKLGANKVPKMLEGQKAGKLAFFLTIDDGKNWKTGFIN